MTGDPEVPSAVGLSPEERRWLYATYQRFDQNEGQLADYRSSYLAAVMAALIGAIVYAVANILPRSALLFTTTVTFLALFGIAISTVWAAVVRRTTEAQKLWRGAALALETYAPPIEGSLTAAIPVRRDRSIIVDLTRPYHAHQERFAPKNRAYWFDGVRPSELSAQVPALLVLFWTGVLAAVWVALAFGS